MRPRSNRVLLLGVLVLLLLLVPALVQAQTAPDLVVTLRDAAGTGIVGATITVHDHDGEGVLAQAQTDGSGTATLATVLMNDVRVAVVGKRSDGTPLKQLATDTGGIALFLDGSRSTTQLDLRVEADGTVIPDPQTMLVPEVVPSPVASVVPTVMVPVSRGAAGAIQPTGMVPLIGTVTPTPAHTPAPTMPPASLSPALLVVVVFGSMVVVAVVAQLCAHLWRNRRRA